MKTKALIIKIIGKQEWTPVLDIAVPDSVVHNGIYFYTWEQAMNAADIFIDAHPGEGWRVPTIKDNENLLAECWENIKKGFPCNGFVYPNGDYFQNDEGSFWTSECVFGGNMAALTVKDEKIIDIQEAVYKTYHLTIKLVRDL